MPPLDLDERVVVVLGKRLQIDALRQIYPLRQDLMPRGGMTVISKMERYIRTMFGKTKRRLDQM